MKNIHLLYLVFFVSISISSQEIITVNNSFEKGLTSWQFGVASYDEDTPDAEFEIVNEGYNDDSACRIKVKINTESKNYNDAYLMYRNLKLKKGKKYRVSFFIKSNIRQDKIQVSLGSGTPPDIQILKDREMKFTGDNTWKKIGFTFEAAKDKLNVNFNDLSLYLGFNHRFGSFYVDDISIKPI